MLRVVLDANVYISAIIRPEGPPGRIVERFLREATFEVVLSPAIIEETLRALAYPKVRKYVRTGVDSQLWFEDIILLAHLVAGADKISAVSVDPDDDKYLAAAIEGRATRLVTGDPDLLTLKEHHGIGALIESCDVLCELHYGAPSYIVCRDACGADIARRADARAGSSLRATHG